MKERAFLFLYQMCHLLICVNAQNEMDDPQYYLSINLGAASSSWMLRDAQEHIQRLFDHMHLGLSRSLSTAYSRSVNDFKSIKWKEREPTTRIAYICWYAGVEFNPKNTVESTLVNLSTATKQLDAGQLWLARLAVETRADWEAYKNLCRAQLARKFEITNSDRGTSYGRLLLDTTWETLWSNEIWRSLPKDVISGKKGTFDCLGRSDPLASGATNHLQVAIDVTKVPVPNVVYSLKEVCAIYVRRLVHRAITLSCEEDRATKLRLFAEFSQRHRTKTMSNVLRAAGQPSFLGGDELWKFVSTVPDPLLSFFSDRDLLRTASILDRKPEADEKKRDDADPSNPNPTDQDIVDAFIQCYFDEIESKFMTPLRTIKDHVRTLNTNRATAAHAEHDADVLFESLRIFFAEAMRFEDAFRTIYLQAGGNGLGNGYRRYQRWILGLLNGDARSMSSNQIRAEKAALQVSTLVGWLHGPDARRTRLQLDRWPEFNSLYQYLNRISETANAMLEGSQRWGQFNKARRFLEASAGNTVTATRAIADMLTKFGRDERGPGGEAAQMKAIRSKVLTTLTAMPQDLFIAPWEVGSMIQYEEKDADHIKNEHNSILNALKFAPLGKLNEFWGSIQSHISAEPAAAAAAAGGGNARVDMKDNGAIARRKAFSGTLDDLRIEQKHGHGGLLRLNMLVDEFVSRYTGRLVEMVGKPTDSEVRFESSEQETAEFKRLQRLYSKHCRSVYSHLSQELKQAERDSWIWAHSDGKDARDKMTEEDMLREISALVFLSISKELSILRFNYVTQWIRTLTTEEAPIRGGGGGAGYDPRLAPVPEGDLMQRPAVGAEMPVFARQMGGGGGPELWQNSDGNVDRGVRAMLVDAGEDADEPD